MFTIEDLFTSALPFLNGISVDVGTLMLGMIALGFIGLGLKLIHGVFMSMNHGLTNNDTDEGLMSRISNKDKKSNKGGI